MIPAPAARSSSTLRKPQATQKAADAAQHHGENEAEDGSLAEKAFPIECISYMPVFHIKNNLAIKPNSGYYIIPQNSLLFKVKKARLSADSEAGKQVRDIFRAVFDLFGPAAQRFGITAVKSILQGKEAYGVSRIGEHRIDAVGRNLFQHTVKDIGEDPVIYRA